MAGDATGELHARRARKSSQRKRPLRMRRRDRLGASALLLVAVRSLPTML